MASINMDSILAKARVCMDTSEKKAQVNNIVNKVILGQIKLETSKNTHTPEDAASKFIEVLRGEINSSGLSVEAIDAISNLDYGAVHRVGENAYVISVYFVGDLSRPSLDESRYGSINDLATLFNNGVDHKMKAVHGKWHGRETWSKTVIPGTHFMEQAVQDFMSNYATDYNVTDIKINGL